MNAHVQAIRAALKAAGYSARQVTVRDGGLYSAITITIRDGAIKLPDVEAAIEPVAPPGIDHYGDGQPFTSAGHKVVYLDAIVDPIADVIEARIVAAGGGKIAEVAPGVYISADPAEHPGAIHQVNVFRWPALSNCCGERYCYGIRFASQRIAVEMLTAGTVAATIALGSAEATDDAWLDRLDLDEA